MEDDGFTASTILGTLSDNMDLDLVDELLYDGCWLETTDGSNSSQSGFLSSSPSNFPLSYFPTSEATINHSHLNQHQRDFVEEPYKLDFPESQSLVHPQMEEYSECEKKEKEAVPTSTSSSQSEGLMIEGTNTSRMLWIGPSKASMKKRLIKAIEYLKELTRDSDILIQIWVPIRRGGKHFLTTKNQPFSYNPNYESLVSYRDVSRKYQFSAEVDAKESSGMPGRVFLKKLPEWTPDVRLFRMEEYPRLRYAQQYSVSGSLALPVFERGSGTCLGVVEIVTTSQKANYISELQNVRKALEAVDLTSSESMSPPRVKDFDELYQAVLAEILDVLKSVCDLHQLPLAQTWAPCVQQVKDGCRHSDENYAFCVSTVDSACYIPDERVLGFHEACSEHHLLRGEGVAGGAFMTHQPCFATDITAFSKTEYALAHHAKMFGLGAAVAIRLRSINTGSADFVLEFFLPPGCKDMDEQRNMLGSLSTAMQQVCRTLHVVDQYTKEENAFPVRERIRTLGSGFDKETAPNASSLSKEAVQDASSWISQMMEAQQRGKSCAVFLGYPKEELPEESKVTNNWSDTELQSGFSISENKQTAKVSASNGNVAGGGEQMLKGEPYSSVARKSCEKKRLKAEKTISLQELRQYFAGSLKDAAKSIGVCPTTLKRICRQHGITRWPSRKIKKVGHSLRKLQLVIDSVQGAEGAIKLSSFYTNFPELSSPTLHETSPSSISKESDRLNESTNQAEQLSLLSPQGTASKSPSSSGSHTSSSSFCCSTGTKQTQLTTSGDGDTLSAEKLRGMIKRAYSDSAFRDLLQEETKLPVSSQGHKSLVCEHPSYEALPALPESGNQDVYPCSTYRVKATFGDEKVRLSLQQDWKFRDLQREIMRRFGIYNSNGINIKYLDDDSEWVLLTCDADLEECIDIHKSSKNRTIKFSLHETFNAGLGNSFGSSGPS